jgi:hypothetical protein
MTKALNPPPRQAACPDCGRLCGQTGHPTTKANGEVVSVSFYCDEHGWFRFLTRSGMVVRPSNNNEMSAATLR